MDNFFDYFEPGEFTEGLADLLDSQTVGWIGSPFNFVCLSTDFLSDEEGYFGENKVRFEDNSYKKDENNLIEISNVEFFDVLVQKSKQYAKKYPNEKEEIEKLLPKIKKKLNLD